MLSKKTKYGLHALFYLAKEYGKGPILIAQLAKSEGIPKKFLESILLELKNKGILHSKKGKGGGYTLARSPKEITLGQAIRVLNGPLAPVSCVSHSAYHKCDECRAEEHCEIRTVMKEVRDSMANILDHTSLFDAIHKTKEAASNRGVNFSI